MDESYSKKVCKGLCTKLDDIGMCMGLCSTDHTYVKGIYDKHKANALKTGQPWEPIEAFEVDEPKVEQAPATNAKPINEQPQTVMKRNM